MIDTIVLFYSLLGPQETSHVAPELKPSVQVNDEGSNGQNKLVVGGSGSGYSLASLNPSKFINTYYEQ